MNFTAHGLLKMLAITIFTADFPGKLFFFLAAWDKLI